MNKRRCRMTKTKYGANCGVCIEIEQWKAAATERLVEDPETITLYIDMCGTVQVRSLGQNRYFITIRRTAHRKAHAQMLKIKSKVFEFYYDYISWRARNDKDPVQRCPVRMQREFKVWEKLWKVWARKSLWPPRTLPNSKEWPTRWIRDSSTNRVPCKGSWSASPVSSRSSEACTLRV